MPNSVVLGLFLKNNGPVWHFQPPVCSFWPAMGQFWHFRRPGLQQPHICNTQTAHPGQRKPPNVQTTNPFGHQCMARHHGALQRSPNAGHLVWPPNLACWALCTFHSSFPPFAPPCGSGTPCPGTKMAKPAKMLRHHIVGGVTWLWFGAVDHNMAGLRGATKSEKMPLGSNSE